MSGRYRTYAPTDDTPTADGDAAFLKFASRRQSTLLEPGTLEMAENVRLDRTTAKVRAGLASVSTELVLDNPPLVLDFTLAADVAVTSITRSGGTATVTTTAAHGYATGNLVEIRGATQTDYNGDFEITVTGASTFTYTVAGSPATPATGTILANAGPVVQDVYADEVQCSTVFATDDNNNTEYIILALTTSAYTIRNNTASQEIGYPAGETVEPTDDAAMHYWNGKVYLFRGYQLADPAAVTSVTSAAGTATVTTTAAHGLSTNDWVYIEGAVEPAYNGTFKITVTGASTYTYAVAFTPTSPATGTITSRKCKPPLVWNGVFGDDFTVVTTGAVAGTGTDIRMPPCAWGIDFKNRLVLPYDRDELIMSDFYDADVYDTVNQQLRIRGGTNDWLVGVHPYQENSLLVFYRKSVHLVNLDPDDLTIISATEISRDIGCSARRSIKTCGDRVFWLSDRGVQSLVIGDVLSLRQNAQPVSDDIDDLIQEINWTYGSTIVAAYWNNRYYLAIPYQTSSTANRILVYNFLNNGWESFDEYPGGFNVENFHLLDYEGGKRLHVSTTFGYAFAMEVNDYDEWGTDSNEVPIPANIQTRYYTGGTLDPKKFRRFSMEANLTTGDAFSVTATTKNPDYSSDPLSFTATSTTDIYYRLPYFGLRGTGCRLTVNTTAGRPEFRHVQAEFEATTSRNNFTLP